MGYNTASEGLYDPLGGRNSVIWDPVTYASKGELQKFVDLYYSSFKTTHLCPVLTTNNLLSAI